MSTGSLCVCVLLYTRTPGAFALGIAHRAANARRLARGGSTVGERFEAVGMATDMPRSCGGQMVASGEGWIGRGEPILVVMVAGQSEISHGSRTRTRTRNLIDNCGNVFH